MSNSTSPVCQAIIRPEQAFVGRLKTMQAARVQLMAQQIVEQENQGQQAGGKPKV